ncbi:MAG: lactate racemase domain-containing protein [Anaerolineae bacterium]|jgi:nickel-dependent lactate racemase|nr:lactate racemase domain-containing protein [Anaerolineae bacterium]
MKIGKGFEDRYLTDDEVRDILNAGLAQADSVRTLDGKQVLVIVPDSTRTAPIPLMFRLFTEVLQHRVAKLDFLVALGTHLHMSEGALNRHLGVTAEERWNTYRSVGVFNHQWDDPTTFATIGVIPRAEIEAITDGMLSMEVPVTINKRVLEADLVIVCGPVFPHEVVGFSGGTKYFFPGVSGPEVINFTHWLGALITSMEVIGRADTKVRDVIDRAVAFVATPKLFCNMVVTHHGMAGLFVGDYKDAWLDAVDLSSKLHVRYVDRTYKRVLSVMPELYDDIWTAAKGMYKVEPVIEDDGEVIIYAPHIDEISYTHGSVLDRIGYHVRDYFVKQWDQFSSEPWGVLAHSTHLRGVGTYDAHSGQERPRIKVTLATGISRERCEQVALGYLDPASIDFDAWRDREDEGILLIPRAGEQLYRVRGDK